MTQVVYGPDLYMDYCRTHAIERLTELRIEGVLALNHLVLFRLVILVR